MENEKNWFIIDTRTKRPLYGINTKSLTFSSYEIANEVAVQFFHSENDYIIVKIPDFKK